MSTQSRDPIVHAWMKYALIAAGLYNIAWGASVVLLPSAIFRLADMELPRYPQIWQCVGMIVGVYGIGYLLAARDPIRHWPITLVGLLGKILGPLGFIASYLQGDLPLTFGATLLINDLIWWVPFAAILFQAFRELSNTEARQEVSFSETLRTIPSHRGSTLTQISAKKPTMVVFLRHAGCTFCREALADIARQRRTIEARGIELAIVHMSDPLQATLLFERYGLEDVHRFSDPEQLLYRAFRLPRGSFLQLFGPSIWWRGFRSIFWDGHGLGTLSGDGFRMPGVFLLDKSTIVKTFHARHAADHPDYLPFACDP